MFAPQVGRTETSAQETPAVAAPAGAGVAPSPATPKAGPPAPKNLESLTPGKSIGVLGKKVIGPDDKDLGLVVDVIVDAEGRPRAAVIDFGGFLGVGSRKIAVDWRLLSFAPGRPDGQVLLILTRAEIQAAPEYKPGDASDEMVGPPWEAPPTADHK